MNPPDGADRMRRADQIIDAVNRKLDSHRSEIARASVVHVTCLVSRTGTLEVKVQTTYS